MAACQPKGPWARFFYFWFKSGKSYRFQSVAQTSFPEAPRSTARRRLNQGKRYPAFRWPGTTRKFFGQDSAPEGRWFIGHRLGIAAASSTRQVKGWPSWRAFALFSHASGGASDAQANE